MTQTEYRRLAKEYGQLPYPVIVTDTALDALYFNPAASACAVIPMTADCIRSFLTPRTAPLIRRCRNSGKPQHFLLTIGQGYTRSFAVTLERKREYLIFSFEHRPDEAEKELKQQLAPLATGFDYIMRTSLHQLMGISDLLHRNEDESVQQLGEKSHRQVLRAMRITRQMEFINNDQSCQVVCFSEMLQVLMEELTPFLQNRFDVTPILRLEGRNAAVKCNIILMKCIVFNLVADLLQHHHGNVLMRYVETADEVILTLRSEIAENEEPDPTAPPLAPASLGISITEELIHRQQGDLLIQPAGKHYIYYLSLPRTETEGAIKEHLRECMQSNMPDLEIAFADLL